MEISVKDLRDKPEINFFVGFRWMSKLTMEEIELWEKDLVEKWILEDPKIDKAGLKFRLAKEVELIERDYNSCTTATYNNYIKINNNVQNIQEEN